MPTPEDWVLLKAVMFLVVPGTVLAVLARRRGASVLFSRPVVPVGIIVLPALLLVIAMLALPRAVEAAAVAAILGFAGGAIAALAVPWVQARRRDVN